MSSFGSDTRSTDNINDFLHVDFHDSVCQTSKKQEIVARKYADMSITETITGSNDRN